MQAVLLRVGNFGLGRGEYSLPALGDSWYVHQLWQVSHGMAV